MFSLLFLSRSGQKEYLTKDRLINFLNEEQRDPRLNEILFPFFDEKRVQHLISKYESDENYVNNGKCIPFPEFSKKINWPVCHTQPCWHVISLIA